MKLAMIAALAENNTIGINNKLPWHLPGDLLYFKAITMGKPVIMGRKTFDSLGKPLSGRTNIVITRDGEYQREGVSIVYSLEEAMILAEDIALINGYEEAMVIGGEQIYRKALPLADRLYLTRIHRSVEGDAFFPKLEPSEWKEVACEDRVVEGEDALAYSYLILDRR
ncbi:MAG: dihydrofolate reductase [Endozoicomonadaceae bacterium]|nr:dihydrofolate reductase [Endozoicomonadaceae bacterium]